MSSGSPTRTDYLLTSLSYLLISAGYVEGVECRVEGMEVGSDISRGIISDVGRRIAEHVAGSKEFNCGNAIGFIGGSTAGCRHEEIVRQFVSCSGGSSIRGSEEVVEGKVEIDSGCLGFDSTAERSVDGLHNDVGSGGSVGGLCQLRGRHWKKNQAKSAKRKLKNRGSLHSEFVGEPESLGVVRESVFSSCSDEVKKELAESRARMLIARNKADMAKAQSYVRHAQMVKESRVYETKFELSRQTSEEKLREISKKRLGAGYVEGTVYSSAATPSMSSGSVSPNSSISMAEVKRKDDIIMTLERKNAELTYGAENKQKIEEVVAKAKAREDALRLQVERAEAALRREKSFDPYTKSMQVRDRQATANRKAFNAAVYGVTDPVDSSQEGYSKWDLPCR